MNDFIIGLGVILVVVGMAAAAATAGTIGIMKHLVEVTQESEDN